MASYLLKISLRAISAFLVLSLVACMGGGSDNGGVFSSQEAAEDQLRLIGSPPPQVYVGAEFSFEFGITGGSGNYRVRYIQNLEGISDPVEREKFREELGNSNRNPVELEIQNLELAKAAFRLTGVPQLNEELNDDGLFSSAEFSYFIEVTDGRETVVEKYDFTLSVNSIAVNITTSNLREGNEYVTPTNITQALICEDAKKYDAGTVILPSGETAYLLQVNFNVNRVPISSSRVFYRTTSSYLETESETSQRNTGSARPDKDYITTEGSFEFNESSGFCSIFVPLLDDQLFESTETFEIEVYKVEGGSLDFQSSLVRVDIKDNEPIITFEPITKILSVGETLTLPVDLASQATTPLEIGVFSLPEEVEAVEENATTVPSDYYSFTPLSQNILFNPGESSSSFGVNFNSGYMPANDFGKDLQLVTRLSVSNVFDFDDAKIIFNEWPLNNLVDNEIVAAQSSLGVASALAASKNGLISVGLTQQAANKEAKIRTFYRNGKPFDLGSSFEYSFGKPGVDIELIDLLYTDSSAVGSRRLLVLLKVNGLLGLSSYGKDDLVVGVIDVDEVSGFQLSNLLQLGTEEADKPIRIIGGDSGEVYILAETSGQIIEGSLPKFGNRGGVDALVYRLNEGSFSKEWARFVGTNEDDEAVDLDAVSSDIHVLTQSVADQDRSQARIDFLDARDGGADIEDRNPFISSFSGEQKVSTIFSSSNGDQLFFSSFGEQSPINGEFSSTNSQDAYITQFNFKDGGLDLELFTRIDSSESDKVTRSELLDDGERGMLAGVTNGRLDGNNASGGQDAFVWGIDLTESSSDAPFKVQFGTPGTDTIIDVTPVLDDKFMVLWSEDHTSGDGSLRYRVSAFAPDGRQLSPSL